MIKPAVEEEIASKLRLFNFAPHNFLPTPRSM